MYCIRCGKQIAEGTKYCIYCGAPTENASANKPQVDDITIPADFFLKQASVDMDGILSSDDTEHIDEAGSLDETRALTAEQWEQASEIQPDDIEDENFTSVISIDEIHAAQKEQRDVSEIDIADIPDIPIPADFINPSEQSTEAVPDEVEDLDFTRAVSKQDILDVLKQQENTEQAVEYVPDECVQVATEPSEPQDDVQMMTDPAESQEEAEQDVSECIDIPIPDDFIHPSEEAEEDEEEEEEYEPLLTRRSIIMVVIVIVLLFAIAAGACISMMRGNISVPEGSGDSSASITVDQADMFFV